MTLLWESMMRFLMILLSTTALVACAGKPEAPTVVEGSPPPPQVVQTPVPMPVPFAPITEKPTQTRPPLQVLADVNRHALRIPSPSEYIGAIAEILWWR